MIHSALMLRAPLIENPELGQLVATQEEFDALKEALHNSSIGGFGRLTTKQGRDIAEVKDEIERFYSNRETVEFVLMYMTGYEIIEENGEFYFIDQSTDLQNLAATSLPSLYLRDQLEQCAADRKMLIIDCFSRHSMDEEERNLTQVRLEEFSQTTGAIVLTSQDTLSTIRTKDGRKNPGFTESIAEGLMTGGADMDQRGYITEEELFLYVYKKMRLYGTSPNLFLSSCEDHERVKIARNINFSSLPTFAGEDDTLNFGRFLRLISQRRKADTLREKAAMKKVIRFQPEVTFLKRLFRAAIVIAVSSGIAAWITEEPIAKAIQIALIVLAGLVIDDFLRRKFTKE